MATIKYARKTHLLSDVGVIILFTIISICFMLLSKTPKLCPLLLLFLFAPLNVGKITLGTNFGHSKVFFILVLPIISTLNCHHHALMVKIHLNFPPFKPFHIVAIQKRFNEALFVSRPIRQGGLTKETVQYLPVLVQQPSCPLCPPIDQHLLQPRP